MGGGCLTGGVVEKVSKNRKLCFIVFRKCCKTPNWSQTKEENKREGGNSVAVLEAFAGQFIWCGENDVRPRHFQSRRFGGPERG